MEGQQFGKWKVFGRIQNGKPGKHFECICECGNGAVIPATTLRAGRSTQCKDCMYHERYNINEMIGKKFGKWTVIQWIEVRNRNHFYKTQCACGEFGQHYGVDLRSGKSKQCTTCHNREISKGNITHGMHKTITYKIWCSMIHRCTNEKSTPYRYYGGRGISVCERWRVFENFLKDMGEKPEGLTIDRIDNNGNYEPGNCRWVTHKENCNNRYY